MEYSRNWSNSSTYLVINRVVSVKFVFVLFRSRQQIVEKSQQIVEFLAEQFVGISKKAKVQQIVGEQFVEQISKFVSFCVLVWHMSKISIVFHSIPFNTSQPNSNLVSYCFSTTPISSTQTFELTCTLRVECTENLLTLTLAAKAIQKQIGSKCFVLT